MYIGNIDSKTALIKWFKEFFNSKTTKTPKYAVLHGPPGNGKTHLVEYLAQAMHLNIHKLTADDNIKDFLQTMNICKLDDLYTKKIILIDSIEDFKGNSIYNIDICNYPIIYTSLSYPPEEIRHGLILPITKPTSSKLFELLKEKQKTMNIKHPDNVLLKIAEESQSVRSAINSLYTGIVQKTSYPNTNILDIKRDLVNRALQQDIDINLLHTITKTGNFYNNLPILKQLALYDISLKVKYNPSIDHFLINNMPAPIESLTWIKQENKKYQKKPKPKPKSIPKEIPQSTHKSIDNWF